MNNYLEKVLNEVKEKNIHEKEYIQAVDEVLSTLEPVVNIFIISPLYFLKHVSHRNFHLLKYLPLMKKKLLLFQQGQQ